MVELYDGGGGLPYLGSATSYNAGDWEGALRTYHDSGVYLNQVAQIDTIAAARDRQGRPALPQGARAPPSTATCGGHGHVAAAATCRHKPALVLDIDETLAVQLLRDQRRQLHLRDQLAGRGDQRDRRRDPALARRCTRTRSPRHRRLLHHRPRRGQRAHTSTTSRSRASTAGSGRAQAGGLDGSTVAYKSGARAESRSRATRSSPTSATSTPTSPAATPTRPTSWRTRSTSCHDQNFRGRR